MPIKKPGRVTVKASDWKRAGLMAGVVAVFTTCMLLLGKDVQWPGWLEPVASSVYRFFYLLAAPARLVAVKIVAPERHGFHYPPMHFIVSGVLTGFAAGVVTLLALGLRRRKAAQRAMQQQSAGTTRREFLAQSLRGAAALGVGGTGAYAMLVAPRRLRVEEYNLPIQGLPEAFEGLRIAHVSDTHYGGFTTRHFLEGVMQRVNDLEPDLIFLTGDYVYDSPSTIPIGVEVLSKLRARLGVVGVLGNHDHWEGTNPIRAAFAKAAIPLVDNGRLFLTPQGLRPQSSHNEECLCIAGLGDLHEDWQGYGGALNDVPAGMPRLLLSHNPDSAELANANVRVDAMFSGHTHGGQVVLPFFPVLAPTRYGKKYLGGLCAGPHFPVVVSRGVGTSVIPLRFNVPPEVGLITLTRA